MPESEDVEGLGQVPPWVLRVVRDLAETKNGVRYLESGVNELKAKVDLFITRAEYQERHKELQVEVEDLKTKRVDPLWEAHNRTAGEVDAQRKSTNLYRWIFGAAISLLGLWTVLHAGGITIHL